MEEYITVAKAAKMAGVTREKMTIWIKKGEVVGVKNDPTPGPAGSSGGLVGGGASVPGPIGAMISSSSPRSIGVPFLRNCS